MPSPRAARAPCSSSASRPRMATSSSTSGSSGGISSSTGDLVAEQLACAEADRVEHVLAHRPWVIDRWMRASRSSSSWRSWRESSSRSFSSDCISASRRCATLLGGEPEQPEREAQHVRHAARADTPPRAEVVRPSRAKTSRDGVSGSTVIASAGRSGTPGADQAGVSARRRRPRARPPPRGHPRSRRTPPPRRPGSAPPGRRRAPRRRAPPPRGSRCARPRRTRPSRGSPSAAGPTSYPTQPDAGGAGTSG